MTTTPNRYPKNAQRLHAGSQVRPVDQARRADEFVAQFANARAFTLIEMTIVLIIIGLITGGVFVGTMLARESALKAVISEVTKYKSAMNAFHEEYHGLPGDIPNATSFWGVAGGDGTGLDQACYDAVGTGTATCNGNNNGQIDNNAGVPSAGIREDLRAWQHLFNANLIDNKVTGTQTGTSSTCGYCASVGVNVPKSKLNGSGYYIQFLGAVSGAALFYDANYGNALLFGAQVANTNGGILKGDEALLLDTKMDDGSPSSGRVLGWKSAANPGCTTSDVDSSAAYNAKNPNPVCALIVKTDW